MEISFFDISSFRSSVYDYNDLFHAGYVDG